MEYPVIFSPDLDVDVSEFAVEWNKADDSSAMAQAKVIEPTSQHYSIDPSILQQGVLLLAGVAGGIAIESLKDVLKERLTTWIKQRLPESKPEIEVEKIPQPDGSILLVVK